MSAWRMFENEEHKFVAVEARQANIRAFGEPCFGGAEISGRLVQRLLRRAGGYLFDGGSLKVVAPAAKLGLPQA